MGEIHTYLPEDLLNQPLDIQQDELDFIINHNNWPGDLVDVNWQYGATSLNVRWRFEVYKHAIDGRPVTHEQVLNILKLSLEDDDTLLDVGCAERSFLYKVRKEVNQSSRLIGLDALDIVSSVDTLLAEEGLAPIEYRVEEASETKLEKGTIDKITALFVLYYDPDSLSVLYDLLKDHGVLYTAVPGGDNKMRHRFWEDFGFSIIRKNVPELANLESPPIHSARFDASKALDLLPKMFREVTHTPQTTLMKIDSPGSQEDYQNSLISMAPELGPVWRRVVKRYIMPYIKEEIRQNGFYWDVVDRHIFEARK